MCEHRSRELCPIYRPCGLIADWSVLPALNDAMSPFDNAFYSFCVFPRSQGTAAAPISYTKKMHSLRMPLMRFDARMNIFCSHGVLSEALREHAGLKSNTSSMKATCFTDKLPHDLFLLSQEDLLKPLRSLLAKCAISICSSVQLQHQTASFPS